MPKKKRDVPDDTHILRKYSNIPPRILSQAAMQRIASAPEATDSGKSSDSSRTPQTNATSHRQGGGDKEIPGAGKGDDDDDIDRRAKNLTTLLDDYFIFWN